MNGFGISNAQRLHIYTSLKANSLCHLKDRSHVPFLTGLELLGNSVLAWSCFLFSYCFNRNELSFQNQAVTSPQVLLTSHGNTLIQVAGLSCLLAIRTSPSSIVRPRCTFQRQILIPLVLYFILSLLAINSEFDIMLLSTFHSVSSPPFSPASSVVSCTSMPKSTENHEHGSNLVSLIQSR